MSDEIIIDGQDFTKVRPADTVVRSLAGIIDLPQLVVKVDEQHIWTEDGCQFDRTTGFEYDPGLNLPDGVIASYLKSWTRAGS